MTVNELVKKRPDLMEKAQKCKTFDEFVKLTKEKNIQLDDISLEQAYDYLSGELQELQEDTIETVSGGGAITNKIKEEITKKVNEYVNPSKKKGDIVAISQDDAQDLLISGSKNLYLDDSTGSWYKLK